MRLRIFAALALASALACSSPRASAPAAEADAQADAPPPEPCNGASVLCARRFDEVSYPTSHNAMSNSEEGFSTPNQHRSMTHQLEIGGRAMMLDTYLVEGVPHLCHVDCNLGKKPLVLGLRDIGAFLATHPREVFSILFESHITGAETLPAFEAAGLMPLLHEQPQGAPWPTLEAMIASGKRLVVFTEEGGGVYPWYHALWSYAFETPYHYESTAEMACVKNRGELKNALFVFNHFLTNPTASEELATQANRNPFFADRVASCRATFGRLPNFVTVDFEDIGELQSIVRGLNGLP